MAGTLTLLGAFVGVVGVSIAIWLQMVARRRCPARHVTAFFAFGSFMLLLNTAVFGVEGGVEPYVAGVALLSALVVEIAGAIHVYRTYSSERPEYRIVEYLRERKTRK